MDQQIKFNQFIQQCLAGDRKSIEILKFNIHMLIKQWSRNNMYETDWVAENKIVIKEEQFLSQCFNLCFDVIQHDVTIFNSYADFKSHVLKIAEKHLHRAFLLFYNLLLSLDDKAWTITHKVLYTRSYSWIKKKGISDHEQIKVVFNEGMARLYEKLVGVKLKFDHAAKLKSYFFRILELLILEYYRESKRYSFQELDKHEIKKIPFDQNIIHDLINEEEHQKLRQAVKKLSETERIIILGYYYEKTTLKEIANNLGKSEENIRVLKHRSLKKLMEILQ